MDPNNIRKERLSQLTSWPTCRKGGIALVLISAPFFNCIVTSTIENTFPARIPSVPEISFFRTNRNKFRFWDASTWDNLPLFDICGRQKLHRSSGVVSQFCLAYPPTLKNTMIAHAHEARQRFLSILVRHCSQGEISIRFLFTEIMLILILHFHDIIISRKKRLPRSDVRKKRTLKLCYILITVPK